MPSLFSRLKGKDGPTKIKSKKGPDFDRLADELPQKPRWEDAWARNDIQPEEVQELIKRCTEELKARALDQPFLLLPFRPSSNPSAVRIFIRHFFDSNQELRGDRLVQELRMNEPMVVAGVAKWCWSRLQGGIVGWDAYELFKVGEQDSNYARDSFKTFIPLSVENGARSCIIFDFFDLLSAIAAHGKANGLGGRKLSRMASWWTFEQKDTGSGFEGGYNSWLKAADATSHLFFAYLRSMAPEPLRGGISMLPMSLQKLVQETEYPPQRPELMMSTTNRVVMVVDTVSPTPFALLRRANHFQYREEDRALREFSEFEDPVQALTEECRRVLRAIAAANQSQVSSAKHSTSLRDASWSRFEDIGFASPLEEEPDEDDSAGRRTPGLRTTPASGAGLGRPTTPSWADFLSTGFQEDGSSPSHLLLPPDKVLPPIEATTRQRSSQSHRPRLETERQLEPGELANITKFDLDDSFWWVWMSSLAPEETAERKSAFGRCAVIETSIRSGRWLVMEEMVVGAAPEPKEGAYVAEKKRFFTWRRNKGIGRRRSTGKQALSKPDKGLDKNNPLGLSKTSIGPDQHAKIQAAAAQLQARQRQQDQIKEQPSPERRGRTDDEIVKEKTNSVFTLQPILTEASSAIKWANKYDKDAIREAYLSNSSAGRGTGVATPYTNGSSTHLGTNGHSEARPAVPSKQPSYQRDASPLPAPAAAPSPVPMQSPSMVITPAAAAEEEPPLPSEKAVEAPVEVHPMDREEAGRSSPMPPPKEPEEAALREEMVSPEPRFSAERKGKKLHKENKDKDKTGGRFGKLFGRKNRGSKVPDNAATDLPTMLKQDEASQAAAQPDPTPSQARPAPAKRETSMPAATPAEAYVTPMEDPEDITPVATPGPTRPAGFQERQYDPSIQDSISQVDTEDANEARDAFARFDQGPLDQPAFVPDDSDTDDAAPPPIQRRVRDPSPPAQQESAPAPSVKRSPQAAKSSPPAQPESRWAQIRKNAERQAAAQRQSEDDPVRPGQGRATDNEDDTSGEETIESRVARIKARVAELTNNMEGSGSGSGRAANAPPTRAMNGH